MNCAFGPSTSNARFQATAVETGFFSRKVSRSARSSVLMGGVGVAWAPASKTFESGDRQRAPISAAISAAAFAGSAAS
jgi:hypothetical protein